MKKDIENDKVNIKPIIIKRDSTLRKQYIEGILNPCMLSKKEKENHYKKYDMDIRICAYCGEAANTLDHIYALVNNKKFSGYTNDISNLIPCCGSCNSSKGNKNWDTWLIIKPTCKRAIYIRENKKGFEERIEKIRKYIKENNTKNKKLKKDLHEIMNKKVDDFNREMTKRLNELDAIFIADKNFFMDNNIK